LEDVIKISDVWKSYGKTIALRGISLTIPKGNVFLLMGPNGAGKSTLLKIITGLIKPTRGKVEVLGLNPWRERNKLFAHIGAMFEDHAFPEWVSGKSFLTYMAKLKKSAAPQKDALQVAKMFEVDKYWDQHIFTYSSGMKRKLALAHAFLLTPELVFLDDPTVALDKQSRHVLAEAVADGTREGKTYVISSHIITEFEKYATYITVLSQGQLTVAGTIEEVAEKIGIRKVTIKTNKPKHALDILVNKGYSVIIEANIITVKRVKDPNEIIELLEKHDIKAEVEYAEVDIWDIYTNALILR